MTRQQQFTSRIIWLILAILLGIVTYYQPDKFRTLSISFLGWCGGIAFVFAWMSRTEDVC